MCSRVVSYCRHNELFQIVTSLVFSILGAVFVIPVLLVGAAGLCKSVYHLYISMRLKVLCCNFYAIKEIKFVRLTEE